MFYFDPVYLLFVGPGMLFGMWAQFKVKSAFGKFSQVATQRGMTGADVAKAILQTENVSGVSIERVDGMLSDHYDPRDRTLRLSPDVFSGRSVAAAGIAAHEVGHAIQHARSYRWLTMRSQLVPVMSITSKAMWPLMIGGMVLASLSSMLGSTLLMIGVATFAVTALFQIVTLPVEFDASKRALAAIEQGNIVTGQELVGARSVLNAAALTYVAAAVTSILTLLYYLMRLGILGGNDD